MERLPRSIILVRHGRTALNAQGRMRGHADVPLDEVGIEEARRAAASLSGIAAASLRTSPLARARQTAAAVGRAVGLEAVVDDRLEDLDHGDWEGVSPEEASRSHPRPWAAFRSFPLDARPPGGESLAELERRLRELLIGDLAGEEEPAILVTHELPIRLLLARLAGSGNASFWEPRLPTGAVVRLDRGGDRWSQRWIVPAGG